MTWRYEGNAPIKWSVHREKEPLTFMLPSTSLSATHFRRKFLVLPINLNHYWITPFLVGYLLNSSLELSLVEELLLASILFVSPISTLLTSDQEHNVPTREIYTENGLLSGRWYVIVLLKCKPFQDVIELGKSQIVNHCTLDRITGILWFIWFAGIRPSPSLSSFSS